MVRPRMRRLAWGFGLVSAVFCGVASADEASAPAPAPAPASEPSSADWWSRYRAARALMARGMRARRFGAQRSTTPGRASFVGSASLWTALVAGAITAGVVPDDDERDNRSWLAAALGVNAGLIAGALTAGSVSPTVARVRFLDLGGIGGLLLSGGLFFASESKSDRLGALVMGGGTAAGLAVAWFATQGMTRDEPETTTSAFGAPRLVAAPARGRATLGLAGEF